MRSDPLDPRLLSDRDVAADLHGVDNPTPEMVAASRHGKTVDLWAQPERRPNDEHREADE
jgi:hypothetical protein